MASDINTRLSAILDKHPQLRPTQDGCTLHYDAGIWTWLQPGLGHAPVGYQDYAHALIFRALVEQALARGVKIEPYVGTGVAVGGTSGWDIGDTALSALINFYEGAEHAK